MYVCCIEWILKNKSLNVIQFEKFIVHNIKFLFLIQSSCLFLPLSVAYWTQIPVTYVCRMQIPKLMKIIRYIFQGIGIYVSSFIYMWPPLISFETFTCMQSRVCRYFQKMHYSDNSIKSTILMSFRQQQFCSADSA